ncbi:hypothetical protein HYALB_00012824, partial [Hymenoscyphus albidus]
MSTKIITVIGSLNTDLVTVTPRVPDGGETLTATSFSTGSGGKGANQAVAAARLSRPKPPTPTHEEPLTVKMIGAVGADTFGPSLIAGLSKDGIDTSSIQTIPNRTTGVAVILVESTSGENRILLQPGANHSLLPSSFLMPSSLGTPLPSLLILQLEIPLETVLQILKTAKQASIPVLLNPAPAVELPEFCYENIDHLILNETEAALLTSQPLSILTAPGFNWSNITTQFLRKGVKNVVITLGSKGAFFAHEGMEEGVHVEATKVQRVVDTTAAGDTFVGSYAVNVVRSGSGLVDEGVVGGACMASARTVQREGAQSAIPWADEV